MWHNKCCEKILQGGEKAERSTRKGVISLLLSGGLIVLGHIQGWMEVSSSKKDSRFSGPGLGFNVDWQADKSVSLEMQRSELSGCMLESEWFTMTGDMRWRETGSEEAGRRQAPEGFINHAKVFVCLLF